MSGIASPVGTQEELPFRVELRSEDDGEKLERVLARAASASLAQAIFRAALIEHPDRRLILSKGGQVVADSRRQA